MRQVTAHTTLHNDSTHLVVTKSDSTSSSSVSFLQRLLMLLQQVSSLGVAKAQGPLPGCTPPGLHLGFGPSRQQHGQLMHAPLACCCHQCRCTCSTKFFKGVFSLGWAARCDPLAPHHMLLSQRAGILVCCSVGGAGAWAAAELLESGHRKPTLS